MSKVMEDVLALVAEEADRNERAVETIVGRACPENVITLLNGYYDMAESEDPGLKLTGALCVAALTRALRSRLLKTACSEKKVEGACREVQAPEAV